MAVAALAQTWHILFVTVVLNAMSEIVFPTLQTYVAERAIENRARAFSMIVNVGPSLALIVTPLLSGLLISIWDMRAAFVLGALTSVASIAIMSRMDFSPPPADPDDTDTTVASYRSVFRNIRIRGLSTPRRDNFSLAVGVTLIPNFKDAVWTRPDLDARRAGGGRHGTVRPARQPPHPCRTCPCGRRRWFAARSRSAC